MATSAATDVVPDVDNQETFGVDPDGELEPEISSDFQVDPHDFTTSKHFKEEADGKKAGNDGVENLKSGLLISAAVIVIAGAVYAAVGRRKIK